MDDQEETLVLNYLEESLQTPMESENDSDDASKLDESFDENQNSKTDIKEEIIKASLKKVKSPMVVLEKRELTPKTLKYSTKINKKRSLLSYNSATQCGKKRKRGRPSAESKKTSFIDPNEIKINGFKSSVFKSSKNLTPKKLEFSSTPKGKKAKETIIEEVIKVENVDDDIPQTTNTSLNKNKDCEEIDIKYETVEQIHSEFKYESLSESEEKIRKKKQVKNPFYMKKSPLKSLKKLESVKGQTTLDSIFKVLDMKIPANNIYKCGQCLYVGNSKANLERHSLNHMNPNDILWYKCTECEYKSKYEYQLKSHTLIHKNPDEIDYFQCPHCEVKCSRKHNLTNHIKSIHADRVNSFKCADCSYSTFSKDRLVAHVKKHSKEVFTCNLCKFVTKNERYLTSHFKLKHTWVDKPFLCDTCSYRGKTKRELTRHYDRMHNKEKLHEYKCIHCNFVSIYKKNLEFHLLHMHQNSKGFQKFICGHCKKDFSYKNGLKTHIIRIHLKLTEEDWHNCQECKYKCKDVNTLKRHIRRNHGSLRLHCKECSFATNRQKSMIAHMKTHEVDTDTILKCPECPYRIIAAVSFVYHMRVLHGKPISTRDIKKYQLVEKPLKKMK